MKNIKLRHKIVLWTVTLEAVLLLVFAAVFVAILQGSQSQQIEQTLQLSAAQLNAVVDIQSGVYRVSPAETAEMRSRGVMAWILSPSGQVSLTIGNAENYDLPDPLPLPGQSPESSLASDLPVRLLVSPLTEGNRELGNMVLALPLHDSQALLRQIYLGLSLAIPLIVLLSAVGGLFLAQRALQPVSAITTTARFIGAADLSQRIDLDLPDDEIGLLADTFNAMLARLEEAFRRERQFTSDVSHELRTPLGMLKTQLSLARSRPRDATALLEMLTGMEGDVDRLTALVEQMLALARVEQHGLDAPGQVDLGSLLHEITNHFQPRARRQALNLQLNLPPAVDLVLQGDESRLRQLFNNLIENAVKYTPENGQINVAARRSWDWIEVDVSNSGSPIPPEHLPHIFERFYRIESSRTRTAGGSGLGLAISREIARQHRGEISAQSNSESGTVFSVHLPVKPA